MTATEVTVTSSSTPNPPSMPTQKNSLTSGSMLRMAYVAMTIAARQLTYAAAAMSERGDPELTFAGAAAKCFASDAAMEITTDAVQLLGGYGYTRDFPVERMMRDAKITQIYEGTNQVQRIVAARQLLKG